MYSKDSQSHSYVAYSVLRVFFWKIGVLRRFLGEFRRRPIVQTRKLRKQLKSYKVSLPKPALVCATGPSLQEMSLNQLLEFKNLGVEIFSVNHFPLTELGRHVEPEYQLALDYQHFEAQGSSPAEISFQRWLAQIYKGKLVLARGKKFDTTATILEINGHCLPTFTKSVDPTRIVGFQPYTSLFAVSLALYLGYSPVYLLGVDASHHAYLQINGDAVTLSSHHAYESFQGGRPWIGRKDVRSILSSNAFFIENCELFAGREVYILGNGSHVDSLPRVSIEHALDLSRSH